ncbi:MAG: 2-amino-4-hydroxy-6-hydroxymethyldihydropteridine diphosphokinase [Terrimesophilobacter sp.]
MTRIRAVLPAVIALGSNQGDRETTIRSAVQNIDAIDGVRVTAASGLVGSAALKLSGVDDSAPGYLNAVILVSSALPPEELLHRLQDIENAHGRVRLERWGDRTLDLDLIDFAGLERNSPDLTLPHPRAWERSFVLVPWAQIDAHARIPGRGLVADLLERATDAAWPVDTAPLLPEADA